MNECCISILFIFSLPWTVQEVTLEIGFFDFYILKLFLTQRYRNYIRCKFKQYSISGKYNFILTIVSRQVTTCNFFLRLFKYVFPCFWKSNFFPRKWYWHFLLKPSLVLLLGLTTSVNHDQETNEESRLSKLTWNRIMRAAKFFFQDEDVYFSNFQIID